MNLTDELIERNLPALLINNAGKPVIDKNAWELRRQEMKGIMCRDFGGYSPEFAISTKGEIVKEEAWFGGKAKRLCIQQSFASPFNQYSFPFTILVPSDEKESDKYPFFVSLDFDYLEAGGIGEEIIDQGYGIAHIDYQEIVPDKQDCYINGLGRFCKRNSFDSWGKIAMWAYGASRVMDYMLMQEYVDTSRVAVIGHSRLGKAALWCGAMDERFSLTVSNDSGGGGAAIFRGKTGEHIKNLAGNGSREWFCGNFFQYTDREEEMPFDQHYLLSLIAPRHLYVASASEDEWADPHSELLACVAASEVYDILGLKGLIQTNPNTTDNCRDTNSFNENSNILSIYHEGRIGYHMRKGTHFLSRDDWRMVIQYRNKHHV